MGFLRTSLALLALSLFGTAPARAADAVPTIDVVICLDVSGSMEGLIGSAKTRLWDVVNDLARVKPTPNLRVALYSYGSNEYEKETGWVRREVDLTTDLDAIAQRLNRLKTPARPAPPKIQDGSWPRKPIDRFILARLESEGLKPSPEADRTTLIRRLMNLAVSGS